MDTTFKDAKILYSGIWHKEVLVNKKKRWLMQLLSQDTSQVGPKKLRKPKSLTNRFLDESFVRNDEVSTQAVKINIENYRSTCFADQRLHEVQNYMVLSDVLTLQSYIMDPSNSMKFQSTLDLLSNNALFLLAKLVTKDKIKFERTRTRMKKVMTDHFTDTRSTSNDMEIIATLQLLSEILINPKNFYEIQPNVPTLSCSSDLKSIYKALELLDSMPLFALNALNLKLRGKKVVPRFPPTTNGYNKKVLVNLIRKRCHHFLSILSNGNSMPKELCKALSVIHLFFKHKTKSSDTLAPEFISFSNEKVVLENVILKALWSLPNVTPYQLKYLQTTLGLKSEDDSSSFQNDIKQYLMQYLFACDEMDIPSDVADVLAILNQSSCSQTQICSKETVEEETEAVLNVSVELKRIVSHFESGTCTDNMASEAIESDDDDDDDTSSNDSQLIESDFRSAPVEYQWQQKSRLESTGESMPETSFVSATKDPHFETPNDIKHDCIQKDKLEDGVHNHKQHYKESMGNMLESIIQNSKDCCDISIKELCDETSLVSYRVIDHMLNSFLSVEDQDASVATRDHDLTGKAAPLKNFHGMEDGSRDNVGIHVLMQSVNDLLPSIAERCSVKVKKLMKQT